MKRVLSCLQFHSRLFGSRVCSQRYDVFLSWFQHAIEINKRQTTQYTHRLMIDKGKQDTSNTVELMSEYFNDR